MIAPEIIALLTTLCWSIGIFPFTIAAQKLGTTALNQYRLLLAWIFISLILICWNHLNFIQLFTEPRQYHYLFLGLSGIIGFTIGDYCSFTSFKILGPKLGSLYTCFAPGAALVLGYFVLDEEITAFGILGILITVAGIIWLTLSKTDTAQSAAIGFTRNPKGIALGIAGACCQGTGLVLSKYGMNSYEEKLPTMHAVWIRLLFAFSAAFAFSIITNSLKKNSIPVFKNKENGLPYMFLGTVLGPVCGVTLSLVAIQSLNVSVAQTIFALLPIFVLPISYFVYKEKINKQSVSACLLAIAGVIVLVWSKN